VLVKSFDFAKHGRFCARFPIVWNVRAHKDTGLPLQQAVFAALAAGRLSCHDAQDSHKPPTWQEDSMSALQPYLNSITIALLALAAMIVFVLLFRSLNRKMSGQKGSRLSISESHDLDKDRRLVLVRRDDVEHLILLGGEHDLVVESNIESALNAPRQLGPRMNMPQSPAFSGGYVPEYSPEYSNVQPLPIRPAPPRPPVFGATRAPLRTVDGSDPDPA
jgi:Flagellar biosynthesis protein, FliO